AIHLGPPLPATSVRSTRGHRAGRPRSSARRAGALLLDLAPGGVYRADRITPAAGGLLHHRFTLTTANGGGLLSVALSRGSPRVGVTDHPALWSPDFPRRPDGAATAWPTPRYASYRGADPARAARGARSRVPAQAGPSPARWAVSLKERSTIGPSL